MAGTPIDLTLPDSAYQRVDGLYVPTVTGLLATLAIRPDSFGDWPGLAEWHRQAARQTNVGTLRELLIGRPAAAWARAAYLLETGGEPEAGGEILKECPSGHGPFYLGPRRPGGRHHRRTDVVDTVVSRYAEEAHLRTVFA